MLVAEPMRHIDQTIFLYSGKTELTLDLSAFTAYIDDELDSSTVPSFYKYTRSESPVSERQVSPLDSDADYRSDFDVDDFFTEQYGGPLMGSVFQSSLLALAQNVTTPLIETQSPQITPLVAPTALRPGQNMVAPVEPPLSPFTTDDLIQGQVMGLDSHGKASVKQRRGFEQQPLLRRLRMSQIEQKLPTNTSTTTSSNTITPSAIALVVSQAKKMRIDTSVALNKTLLPTPPPSVDTDFPPTFQTPDKLPPCHPAMRRGYVSSASEDDEKKYIPPLISPQMLVKKPFTLSSDNGSDMPSFNLDDFTGRTAPFTDAESELSDIDSPGDNFSEHVSSRGLSPTPSSNADSIIQRAFSCPVATCSRSFHNPLGMSVF